MKLKYSALLSDARGILNGSYASRDRYGAVLRNRVIPRNPQSAKQQSNRNMFSFIARRWRTISQHCRDEWAVYARTKPYKDIFGDRKYLQPNALFIQYNMNNMLYGFPFLECPILEHVEFPDFPIQIEPPNLAAIIITYPPTKDLPNTLVLQATKPTKKKKNNVESDYTTIAVLKESDFVNGKYNARNDYIAEFGEYGDDEIIYFQYFFADKSGRVSLPKDYRFITNTLVPAILGTAYRFDDVTNDVYITAEIINLPLPFTEPYTFGGRYSINDFECERFPSNDDMTYQQLLSLQAGEEVLLGKIDPATQCLSYVFSIYTEGDPDAIDYFLTHVNPSNFPVPGEVLPSINFFQISKAGLPTSYHLWEIGFTHMKGTEKLYIRSQNGVPQCQNPDIIASSNAPILQSIANGLLEQGSYEAKISASVNRTYCAILTDENDVILDYKCICADYGQ